jgi:5-methylthioadenosine/S-adenosylhomocysteine deaminase
MEHVDQLLHARWVITCEPNHAVLDNHSIAVHNGLIKAILPTADMKTKYKADQETTLENHALIPGLINAHTHLAMNVFRGLADDLELMDWLNNHIWPAEGKWVSDEMVYDASLLAMGEMIRCGTTCFNDMYFFLDATAKAAIEAGIRAHIGMTVIDVPTAWAKTTDEYFEKSIAFYEQYRNHPLVTPTLAPHSTYTVSLENLARVKKLADDYGLQINIHLQESEGEIALSQERHQKRPLERLNDIHMLSKKLITIHMTQVNEDEMTLLKKNNVHVVHCPESNMKLASGSCPVQSLLDHGINVALGTDGAASNNDLDMISEMRSAAFLGKLSTLNPKAVTAETVLQMATLNGAKALGVDHLTGSLKAGKAADITAIDLGELETQPLYHPVSQIVYAASRHQVTNVWIGGKHVLKNRELQTLNYKTLLEKAKKWQAKLSSKATTEQIAS